MCEVCELPLTLADDGLMTLADDWVEEQVGSGCSSSSRCRGAKATAFDALSVDPRACATCCDSSRQLPRQQHNKQHS